MAVHSATEDLCADPVGESLSVWHAGPVWKLYGLPVLDSPTPPPPECPVGGAVSYFLRTGKHDMLPADWNHYMDVADRAFGRA